MKTNYKLEKSLRIYHGPVNIGGVGRFLSDWERQQGAISDFIVFSEHSHTRKKAHLVLHIRAYHWFAKIIIALSHFVLCLVKYDIYHFHFGNTLLPFHVDLPILKLFGKKMLMTYYGSDIRLIEVEKQRNPYYEMVGFGANHPKRDKWKKLKMFWQNLWIDRFFAIRELYEWATTVIPEEKVIEVIWLVTPVNVSEYSPSFETKDVPTLVHAPSIPKRKGTDFVEQAVTELRNEGYQFQYLKLTGVPNEEAQTIYREEADIIIDAFYSGSFGILAVEGMFYGKPVCCYIMDDVLQKIPDCPIVNCTIDNLKKQLAWLIDHPEERVRIGKAGRAFVEKYCDSETINQRIWQIYQELLNQ